ncbi:MAG: hypothetical protein KGQ57_13280 [Burkholderiales bacterium]|nr:hypothetical protein [Burkholderiales bacterium]
MSWTAEDFKSTSLEVGQWCWGTLQGAFNEKQTISQIIVDAAIGIIPLLGDATAVRDLLAVAIRMSNDPTKRREVAEWVLLVVLLFALIPVVGGVIKGVGRLALRVTGDAAKDAELLAEVIRFLNRMGHGDAPKWLSALDLGQYQSQILNKCKDFCATMQVAIRKSLDARVGRALPQVWRAKLERVRQGFFDLQDLADTMIPQAFKELNAKLHTLQNMVYRGEIHEITTGGMPKVKREAEAYLDERKLAREIKRGRYDPTQCEADGGRGEARIRTRYQPKINQGWPDILSEVGSTPFSGKDRVFVKLASFHGDVSAVGPEQLAGKKLYRAFGNPSKHAPWQGGSKAGGRQPAFWGIGEPPRSAEEWRVRTAVLDEWNGNGFIAVLQFPTDLARRMPEAKGWAGKIAEQYGTKVPSQFLEGGGEQLIIDLGPLSNQITKAGEQLKGGGHVAPLEWNGIRVEFRPTNWENVEDRYGYSQFIDDFSRAVRTRRLATDEIQTKLANSKITAVARSSGAGQEEAR